MCTGSSGAAAAVSCKPRPSMFRPSWKSSCSTSWTRVILTSATLAVGGTFEFAQKRLGIRHARTLIVPEPFRLSEAGAAVCPAASARSAHSGVHGSGGRGDHRAFWNTAAGGPSCCSPAISRCALVYDRVSLEIEYPTLLQGTGPRNALLDEFRAHAELRPVRDLVLLAGRGCAGRAIKLRDHRQAAVRGAERSGGGSAHRRTFAKRAAIRFTITRFRRPLSRSNKASDG